MSNRSENLSQKLYKNYFINSWSKCVTFGSTNTISKKKKNQHALHVHVQCKVTKSVFHVEWETKVKAVFLSDWVKLWKLLIECHTHDMEWAKI